MAGGSGRGYESCSFIEPKRTRCLVHYGTRQDFRYLRNTIDVARESSVNFKHRYFRGAKSDTPLGKTVQR